MPRYILTGVLALTGIVCAQRRVDPRNTYFRAVCAVPLVGAGSAADPKRPEYAPSQDAQNLNGIIAFESEPSDDSNFAVVEFVATSREAFQPLFNDRSITLFEKGRASKSDIETALKQFRKDFDLDKFGLAMPSGPLGRETRLRAANATSYRYYLAESLSTLDVSRWATAGRPLPSQAGMTARDANGGVALSRMAAPDGTSEGEVRMTLALSASGGAYAEYLQSSPDTRSSTNVGTYLAFEMQNPTFTDGLCSARFSILESVAGSVSALASFPHSCRNGMVMRMAAHGSVVLVWPDQDMPLELMVPARSNARAMAGQPGVGVRDTPPGNAIAQVQLGTIDRTPPTAVDSNSIGVSAFRRRVDVQWKAVSDDPQGSGLAGYWVYRDGNYLMRTASTFFSDETVKPGSQYIYTIYAVDQHYNFAASASVHVTTPSAVPGSVGAPPPPVPIKK